jgi:sec-independent protein translocase protein TatA
MFSSIGWGEIAIIVVLVLLLFGARKLPEIGQSLGRSITGFRKGLKETSEDVKAAIKEDVTADAKTEATTDPTVTSSADKSGKTE